MTVTPARIAEIRERRAAPHDCTVAGVRALLDMVDDLLTALDAVTAQLTAVEQERDRLREALQSLVGDVSTYLAAPPAPSRPDR
jgi:outer membrane protein TolC